MNILVINAGSSSLKYQLIEIEKETVLAKGICERIGMADSQLKHKPASKDAVIIKRDMPDHTEAIKTVLEALTGEHGVINSMKDIHAVGHRVVHGGEDFSGSVIINEDVITAIEANSPLAPLHNPANLMGITACAKVMGDTPMVGVFDTAFHQTMPEKAFLYGLPYDIYKDLKVRRYGFHGTSHLFVSRRAAELLGKPFSECKLITCHLGNGSSISAVDHGKSVDTSMGLTPLEGLVMGTRSGDIDPAIIEYLINNAGMDINEVMNILNKKSGMLGLSGVSSDFRDLWDAYDKGDKRAKIALEVFCYRVKKYIGAYAAVMNGADAIIFTAGIGENDPDVREWVMKDMDYLGVDFDASVNNCRGKEIELTKKGSRVKVFVIPTDEEMVIARDTLELLSS